MRQRSLIWEMVMNIVFSGRGTQLTNY